MEVETGVETHTKQSSATSGRKPIWPQEHDSPALQELLSHVPALIEEAEYHEVYGVQIGGLDFRTKLILQKFLRANANDVEKARTQLLATLKCRKEFQPLKAKEEVFSKSRFGGLGYIVSLSNVPGSPNPTDTAVFNIYGAVKNPEATFSDLNSFLRWRVALMELSLSHLNLSSTSMPIPSYSATNPQPDPHQLVQVHDYLSISFLRQNPYAKAAAKTTISMFQKYYPETLSRKFFVNVPVVMGWMFKAAGLVISAETRRKFCVLSYGNTLVTELGDSVPTEYGGKAGPLVEVAETVKEE